MSARLLHQTPWQIAAYAARTCYQSHDKSTEDADWNLLLNCIKRGHESVLEHIIMTWEVECTRACSHQLVRHRIASYSQQSQRYVKLGVDDGVWWDVPEALENSEYFADALEIIGDSYQKMLADGIKAEDARAILPNCTLTKLVVTMNMRSFRNFYRLRTDRHAQKEIYQLVFDMVDTLDYKLRELTFYPGA